MTRYTGRDFDPIAHEDQLRQVIDVLASMPTVEAKALNKVLHRYPKAPGESFSKAELITGARRFAERYGWDAVALATKLRMKPVRTASGVAPITVLTQPYPCPGRCIFCPNDVRMPKSYLAMEPGAQRAAQNRFDPYAQTISRLKALFNNGHLLDKVELIVLGGTWSFYPHGYQVWFVTRCFEAMNDFHQFCRDDSDLPSPVGLDFDMVQEPLPSSIGPETYNATVQGFLRSRRADEAVPPEQEDWSRLVRAQAVNESSTARCVGLVVETRPDHVSVEEVVRLRRLGATKVQVGLQSLSDEVLTLNGRGHPVAASRTALGLLRRAGFKLQGHWMANLYGSDPDRDLEDYRRLWSDLGLRPDELKLYPCSLIETAELMTKYQSGEWRPYDDEELLRVVAGGIAATPPYCRLNRVIRDIPSHDIVVGNQQSNFRETAEAEVRRQGRRLNDIRAREVRTRSIRLDSLRLEVIHYESSVGRERFLQLVDEDGYLAGFLRLTLPKDAAPFPELDDAALLRELHVYGAVAGFADVQAGANAQHRGLGRRLVDTAKAMAVEAGYGRLSVISAVGTRDYYRRLGFGDGDLYQHWACDPVEVGAARPI